MRLKNETRFPVTIAPRFFLFRHKCMQWFQQRGLWLASSTAPAPGMLIFFDWATQDGVPDHVGIVERVENGYVYTIEGNSNDVCRQKQYSLASSVLLGYGMPAA